MIEPRRCSTIPGRNACSIRWIRLKGLRDNLCSNVVRRARAGGRRPAGRDRLAAGDAAAGTILCSSSKRFPAISLPIATRPVRLPEGRLRLATTPVSTGSAAIEKTTGMVFVAALAAIAELRPTACVSTGRGCRRPGKRCRGGDAHPRATDGPSEDEFAQ